MANRYFNKQVTESRKPLAVGGALKKITEIASKPHSIPPKDYKKFELKDSGLTDKTKTMERPKPKKTLKFFDNTDKTPKPKSFDNTDRTDREKIIKDKIKDRLEKSKNSIPELKGMEGFKKVSPKSKTKSESPERKRRQADYMKKHGEKTPSRKTLSVTNSYKKEVEGLK